MWYSKLIELCIIVFIYFKSFSVNLAFAIKLLLFKVVSTHFSCYKTLYTLGSDCCSKKKIMLAEIHITQISPYFFTDFSIELLLLLRKVVCTHLSRHKFWKRNAAAVKMSPFFVEKQFSTTSHNCRCREAYYVGISATCAL